ncbi:MAG: aspartate/glutamate racemase family protein [Hyphomicrobiaceae bacterium]|nr:aspartate/glutamate racemase family protein [Hyphomicrobiaceae bacterium]MCC0024376.1 aspartate/glutamate racemase family protein [Hyphomicrobiaceae bacterium]
MKTIGLIGGMSWESSALYYRIINQEVGRKLGGLHSADILMRSFDFAPIEEMQSQGNWDEAGALLAEAARQLEEAGADMIGLCTNTMHLVASQIETAISVPFIHIARPTAARLREDGFACVGLLGTQFTMEMGFYADILRAEGLDPIVPDIDITNLNAIIYEELCRGIIRDQSRQTYIAAIERLAQRGAEAVILGCTEIGMLIDDAMSPIPTYDTTELHAKALVDLALA